MTLVSLASCEPRDDHSMEQLPKRQAISIALSDTLTFTNVRSAAFIRDYIVVADPAERRLVAFSAQSDSAFVIGRVGNGPEEYQMPEAVFPFTGDSVLVFDGALLRLAVVAPDFKIQRVIRIPVEFGSISVSAADNRGNVYLDRYQTLTESPSEQKDSTEVLRWSPNSDPVVVARVKAPRLFDEVLVEKTGSTRVKSTFRRPIPFAYADVWSVDPDGNLWIARSRPYGVDRLAAGSNVRRHWDPPSSGRELTRTELATIPSSVRDDIEREVPPFDRRGRVLAINGSMWLKKHSIPGSNTTTYDVFAEGGDSYSVTFPGQVDVILVSDERIYGTQRGPDDLIRLVAFRLDKN